MAAKEDYRESIPCGLTMLLHKNSDWKNWWENSSGPEQEPINGWVMSSWMAVCSEMCVEIKLQVLERYFVWISGLWVKKEQYPTML